MNTNMRRPCNDCPFRREALAGWLGPWRAEEVLTSLHYRTFECHQTVPEGLGEGVRQGEVDELEVCAGSAIFLNNILAVSRDQQMREMQELVGKADDVFSRPEQFLEYHARRAPEAP